MAGGVRALCPFPKARPSHPRLTPQFVAPLLDNDRELAEGLASSLDSSGGTARAVVADLREEDACAAAVDGAVGEFVTSITRVFGSPDQPPYAAAKPVSST
jgi:hypothetical protein